MPRLPERQPGQPPIPAPGEAIATVRHENVTETDLTALDDLAVSLGELTALGAFLFEMASMLRSGHDVTLLSI